MTIRHHLSDPLLIAYAAGNLPEAFSLVVATHVSMCDDCRARLGAFEAVGGAVVESASTEALFAQRAHPYTQGLFAARPPLGLKRGTRLQTIPGNVPEIFNWPKGCAFADRCAYAEDSCRQSLPQLEQVTPPNHTSSAPNATDHWVRCPKWQHLEVSA